jgi:hypothetical protein
MRHLYRRSRASEQIPLDEAADRVRRCPRYCGALGARARIAVLLSRREGLPLSLIEATL